MEHAIWLVCDTGNKAVRLITSATGLVPLQREIAKYANMFRLDKNAKQDDDHLKNIQEVVAFFSGQEEEAKIRTGKLNTNGPDMTVLTTTRQSFVIAPDSLTTLANTLTEIGHEELINPIRFTSMTTLSVESFLKVCVPIMTCQQLRSMRTSELAVFRMTCFAFIRNTSATSLVREDYK